MANKYFNTYRKKIEFKHDPLIKAELDAMIDSGVKQYEDFGSIEELPKEGMRKAIEALHLESGSYWARYTEKNIIKQQKKSAIDNYLAFMQEYLNRYLMDRSVNPIEGTQRKIMLQIINDGLANGDGVNEIARKLKDLKLSNARAKLIVRTETGRAMNTGAMFAAANSSVVVNKVWNSAIQKRTRRIPEDQFDHLRMNGIEVPYDGFFLVPSMQGFEPLSYPCDPIGSPGNVINCRCAVSFKPTGEVRRVQPQNEFTSVINFVTNNLVTLGIINAQANG